MADLKKYNLQDVNVSQPRQSWHNFGGSTNNLDRALSALQAIPPDLPRDDWHKVGRAAIAAGLTIDDIDTWSAGASNYKSTQDVKTAFHTITPDGGTQAGTLFKIAAENGWRTSGNASPRPSPQRTTKPTGPPRQPVPGQDASEVFARCELATNQHGYIVKKQGTPEGLRVVPAGDRLTIAGQSMAGFLAVPAYAPDGEIQSIQFIPPPGIGKKLNLPGAYMSGASFTLGTDGTVYLCEGIGAAWSAWQATGHRAVCCFGWGNVKIITAQLRQQDSAARMVICPDVGKESSAAEIAALHQCSIALMPDGWDNNSDLNDLFCAPDGGVEVVQALLEAATEAPKPPPLLKPVSVFDVITNPAPPPGFVWDGYLPRGNVALLGAHGGTGKSTIALMLAVCTVLGRPLFGVDTQACKVLFVSLEDGSYVVRHRLAGICKAWLIDPEKLRDKLLIVDGTEYPELFAAETRGAGEITASYFELRKLVQSENIGLVLVDNASDAFGGDEIQRRQVRAFMRALAEIARLTDCAVMLLAHVDKNTSRNKRAEGGEGYSGSTAWHNSARSRLFLTRGGDGLLTLEHQKSNLGKMREPLTLNWLEGGLPMIDSDATQSGFADRMNGRAEDDKAIVLLKMIAEFEGREQFCSPAITSRNHVHAVLKSEPAFLKLKLRQDDTKRIVTQCQRAKWIEQMEYRYDRKPRQRWTVTTEGRAFAGLPAPTAPTAPNTEDGAHSEDSAAAIAPTAPTGIGGVGERAHTPVGAKKRREGKEAKP